MIKKILLCGTRSFVATGLYETLIKAGFQVDCFTRGKEERNGDQVSGDVFKFANNPFLASHYDIVINFIVIKDGSLADNLQYAKEVVELCRIKTATRLVHISSIMVYDNNDPLINEKTELEQGTDKTGYGFVKIEVDRYLQSLEKLPFSVSFIRPGYVLAADRTAPFIKRLPLGYVVIKGNRNSIMPIVRRETIHKAIVNVLELKDVKKTYLFTPSYKQTKYEFAKSMGHKRIISLPKWLILGTSKLFVRLGLLSKSFYVRIEGMYIESKYDSTQTEKELNIKF
jgi:nucleoside-diphosphate-sugar epimerase